MASHTLRIRPLTIRSGLFTWAVAIVTDGSRLTICTWPVTICTWPVTWLDSTMLSYSGLVYLVHPLPWVVSAPTLWGLPVHHLYSTPVPAVLSLLMVPPPRPGRPVPVDGPPPVPVDGPPPVYSPPALLPSFCWSYAHPRHRHHHRRPVGCSTPWYMAVGTPNSTATAAAPQHACALTTLVDNRAGTATSTSFAPFLARILTTTPFSPCRHAPPLPPPLARPYTQPHAV